MKAPNQSIEATNNGVQRLRAFASAQPPLFAPHLQRYAVGEDACEQLSAKQIPSVAKKSCAQVVAAKKPLMQAKAACVTHRRAARPLAVGALVLAGIEGKVVTARNAVAHGGHLQSKHTKGVLAGHCITGQSSGPTTAGNVGTLRPRLRRRCGPLTSHVMQLAKTHANN